MISLQAALDAARRRQTYDVDLGWICRRKFDGSHEEPVEQLVYLIALTLELSNRVILLEQQATQYADLWKAVDNLEYKLRNASAALDAMEERVAALAKAVQENAAKITPTQTVSS